MREMTTIQETRQTVKAWKAQNLTVGFVPTMGYLHPGHISLIKRAKQENDRVAVSIYVNPLQFGPNEDYEKYPRNRTRDLALCKEAGADLVFAPTTAEMCASDTLTFVDIQGLGDHLCGASRPGHFQGVCTIVSKLFHIIMPDKAYFGEKDAQQLAIIKRMVQDLNFDLQIVPCPIVREEDGLAMSSRNAYLSDQERKAAVILSKSLQSAKQLLDSGEKDAQVIRQGIISQIQTEPLAKINYVEIVDAGTLQPVNAVAAPVLVAAAVHFGKTRLIDNFSYLGV
ncbi:MAG: pantoate--beta-alanine ligase [Christensenellales bacterium]